ncbi:hypothetical protein VZT92_021273 [Zoarces viviparus]|uniref:Uncharacterized protein n=1 Tax=Zoarces viviparus TaxID=48416 RepID=A0AAW1EH00_ZOAVI
MKCKYATPQLGYFVLKSFLTTEHQSISALWLAITAGDSSDSEVLSVLATPWRFDSVLLSSCLPSPLSYWLSVFPLPCINSV